MEEQLEVLDLLDRPGTHKIQQRKRERDLAQSVSF
jgi:hypothetical protein